MTRRDLFRLPPYVLYLSRAFSTLEGIGLSVNPDYSILQECYPYLARRLFADSSPRAKDALRTMLFGQAGGSVSPQKLLEMGRGFGSYTAAVSDADSAGGARRAEEALLDLLLDPRGNALQDILVEEAARATDALVREGVSTGLRSRAGRLLSSAARLPVLAARTLLPRPLFELTRPLQLPYLLGKGAVRLTRKSSEDEAVLVALQSVARTAWTPLEGAADSPLGLVRAQLLRPDSLLRRTLADPQLRRRFPQVSALSLKYGAALLDRMADRLDQTAGETAAPLAQRDAPLVGRLGRASASAARTLSAVLRPRPRT